MLVTDRVSHILFSESLQVFVRLSHPNLARCMLKWPEIRLHASLHSTSLLLHYHHSWILCNAFSCNSLVEQCGGYPFLDI